jgi:hypothetical protein
MFRDAILPVEAARLPRGLCFAVLISAAVHGLFGVIFWALSTNHSQFADDKPLAEIPVLVLADEPLNVSLPEEQTRSARGGSTSKDRSETDANPIEVQPLPLDTGAQPSNADVPRVVSAGAARHSVGDGGPPNEGPTFFGVQLPAGSVVFVVDRSLSMGINNGLDAVKRELLAKLDRLPAVTRFQVLFYDSQVECLSSFETDHLLANTEETRGRIAALVKSIRARAGTDHLTGLRRALALWPEAILFITDADDLRRDQVRAITEANHGRTAIHTLQWSLTPLENDSLKDLARLNRGTYRRLGP